MKRIICVLLCLFLMAGICFVGGYEQSVEDEVAAYLVRAVPNPTVSSIGGEHTVIALARMEADVPDGYFDIYLKNLEAVLKEADGVLHARKYTEYSRVVLALTALGKDARSFAGYDMVLPLLDYDSVSRQGINGPIFALLALDCAPYAADNQTIRKQYIDYILSHQNSDGGFSLGAEYSDPDITGMALCALAAYRTEPEVTAAIDRGVSCLSAMQSDNGGYTSWGTSNAESTAQVIIALCALDIPLTDKRFVKDAGLLDALMSFKRGNGYAHRIDDKNIDLMATEQAAYALCAAARAEKGEQSFYDMTSKSSVENILRKISIKRLLKKIETA